MQNNENQNKKIIKNKKIKSMVKITIEYNQSTQLIDLDENETVLTLKYIVSDTLNIPEDKLILKGENGSNLVNDSQKVSELLQNNSNTIKINAYNLAEMNKKEEQTNNQPNFMDISNMDLSPIKPLLKDKSFMKNMFENNPMVKNMMEKNPEMKAAFNSGSFTEELQKMVDDPEYMKEQMKNGDLAMKKIKNIPGGLATLNSYMSDIRNPMLESMRPKNKLKGDKNLDEFKYLGIKNMPIVAYGNPLIFDYTFQLCFLEEKGFKDFDRNIKLLESLNGNVHNVLEVYNQERRRA